MDNQKEKTILYIEDDDVNCLLIKKILKESYIQIVEAEDGLKGIELVKQKEFDLILIDINMEGLNGYEIATRLKMLRKNVPIVALTANRIDRAKERALAAGCDGFISKPFDPFLFSSLLMEYINGRKDKINNEHIVDILKINNQSTVCHLEEQIRELKRANEELRELDKMKSKFISLVSHELRTPLSPIVGYLSFLLSNHTSNFSDREARILDIIYRNSKRLERLLENLFTLDLLEQKEKFLSRESVQLNILLSNLIEDYKQIFQKRNLSCNLFCEKEVPDIICDEAKIEQVFFSILENAIKYTKDGGKISIYLNYPSRYISNKYDLSPNDYIEVIIEDNGIGIPENQLNAIFEKFVELSDIDRHHSSNNDFLGGGTGIGLSLCKGIVKEHRGFIWAENRKSHNGSRFYIILPLRN